MLGTEGCGAWIDRLLVTLEARKIELSCLVYHDSSHNAQVRQEVHQAVITNRLAPHRIVARLALNSERSKHIQEFLEIYKLRET